jgi:hypothetical protein
MPALADITVKKADGTTDVVWYGIQPSAGINPAIWRNVAGSAWAFCPEIRMTAKEGPRGASRLLRATLVWPEIATNTTTGLTSVANRARFTGEWEMPKGMSDTPRVEFAYQTANLLAATLFKTQVSNGMAAV